MNTTIIQQYIQFGIDNWWEPFININKLKIEPSLKLSKILEKRLSIKLSYISDNDIIEYFNINSNNIYKFITSKQFIEAVARWMTKYWCQTEDWEMVFKDKVKWIIVHQAKAIAEFEWDTLEDFIINLWLWTEKN